MAKFSCYPQKSQIFFKIHFATIVVPTNTNEYSLIAFSRNTTVSLQLTYIT